MRFVSSVLKMGFIALIVGCDGWILHEMSNLPLTKFQQIFAVMGITIQLVSFVAVALLWIGAKIENE